MCTASNGPLERRLVLGVHLFDGEALICLVRHGHILGASGGEGDVHGGDDLVALRGGGLGQGVGLVRGKVRPDDDGTISFQGDELPYGSYRVTEQSAPDGYQKDTRVETVEWDGTRDVTITFENVRDIGLTIVKKDGDTGVSLPGATFDVFADGEKITSVTTNDAGEAYVTGIKKEAYIERSGRWAGTSWSRCPPSPDGCRVSCC